MSAASYKPSGHPDVSVYIMAADAEAVMAFAADVFGAQELMKMTRPDGAIMHAEIRIGDSVSCSRRAPISTGPFRCGCTSMFRTSMRPTGKLWQAAQRASWSR